MGEPQVYTYLKIIEFLGYFPFKIEASTVWMEELRSIDI